ncbi:hypothetical protein THOM_0574 [Trachipleistophora hominis]|uniref:Uncharacterized protein n=1 Tax=Trachipleistophora hominis TaxID=72359 RepID=L7JYR8_TRAHO|nr:hypothetical protein THOM_0574 [Trachipleistophora hominis]
MNKEISDETVLEEIEKINSCKKSNADYYINLINLEDNVDKVSLFVSIQACTVLSEDFYVYSKEEKASIYVEKGLLKFDQIVKMHLIEKKDFYSLVECLSRMLIVRVKITNCLNILSRYQSFLLINSEKIFNFLLDTQDEHTEMKITIDDTKKEHILVEEQQEIEEFASNGNKLLFATDFISTNEQFDIFLFFFGLFYDPAYKSAYLNKLANLRKKFERALLIEVVLNTECIAELADYVIKQKNGLNELSTIFMISLKINELNTFKVIIIDFLKIANIFTDEETANLRLITTSLIKNLNKETNDEQSLKKRSNTMNIIKLDNINFLLDIDMKSLIDWDDLVRFLHIQGNYAMILCLVRHGIKVERKILFACYLFTDDIISADKLYEEELQERFTTKAYRQDVSCDEMQENEIFAESMFKNDLIEQTHIFIFFMKKGRTSSAFNIMEKIDTVDEFIVCMKTLLPYDRRFLKDAIYIGIKKFYLNHNFLKISLSILHLEDINVTADERATLILELYFNNNDEPVTRLWPDETFVYNILYNNILEVTDLDLKCRLLKEIRQISMNEDTLFLFLYVMREIEQKMFVTNTENAKPGIRAVESLTTSISDILTYLFDKINTFKPETLILLYDYYKQYDKDKSDLAFNYIPICDLSESSLFFLCDITDDTKIVRIVQAMQTKRLLTTAILDSIYVRFSAYGVYNLIALCDELEMKRIEFKSDTLHNLLRTKLQYLKALKDLRLKRRILHFLSD